MKMAKPIRVKQPKRCKSIKIRVSSDEFLQLKNKADGKQLAPFMRNFCLNAKIPKRRAAPKVDPEFMRKFAGLCNNVNQLTKQVNSNSYGLPQLALLQELKLIREELDKVKSHASKL